MLLGVRRWCSFLAYSIITVRREAVRVSFTVFIKGSGSEERGIVEKQLGSFRRAYSKTGHVGMYMPNNQPYKPLDKLRGSKGILVLLQPYCLTSRKFAQTLLLLHARF